jgi:hypothetical protein
MLAQLSQDTLAVSGAGAARSRRPTLSSPAARKRGRMHAVGGAGGGGGGGDGATPPAPTLLRARCSCERRDTTRRLDLPTVLAATILTATTTTTRTLTAAVAALLPLQRVRT